MRKYNLPPSEEATIAMFLFETILLYFKIWGKYKNLILIDNFCLKVLLYAESI